MNPADQFNKDLLYVLNKVEKCMIYAPSGAKIEYVIHLDPSVKSPDAPSPMDEIQILRKMLDEYRVVREVKPSLKVERSVADIFLSPIVFFYLEVVQPKFDQLLVQIREDVHNLIDEKRIEVVLQNVTSRFDSEGSMLLIAEHRVMLSRYGHEYYLCEVLYGKNIVIGQRVDWSRIFARLNGDVDDAVVAYSNSRPKKRAVVDTVKSLNARIAQRLILDRKVFECYCGAVWRNC